MKRMLMIGILWVFTMTACTLSVKSTEPIEPVETSSQTLSAIDNLMWQQPDSAFILLQEFAASPKADSLDAFGGHYFQLLLSELLYKNDYAQTNRTELRQAVAYFDSLFSILNDKPSHHEKTTSSSLPLVPIILMV